MKQREFQGNIIIIDGDSYRSFHPNYLGLQEKYGKDSVDYTKVFAGKMVEYLVDELSKQGYHLLIEGTLRTTEVPRKTTQLLITKGYQISLALIATKPELSYLSTLIRYEELYAIDPRQARATPKAHHDGIVEHLVENLRELEKDQLFRQIQIFQRDQSCVYDSQVDETSAAEVLQECLFGKWSKVEIEMLKLGQERLKELNTETKKYERIFLCSEDLSYTVRETYEKNFKESAIFKSSAFRSDIKFWRYLILYSSHDLCDGA